MASKEDKMRSALGDRVSESTGVKTTDKVADPAPAAKDPQFDGVKPSKNVRKIPLDKLVPDPAQPRKVFDADKLAEMASSLKQIGQLQPIRVRWDGAAKVYVIISGERRYQGAKAAGLPSLDCVVMDRPFDGVTLLVEQMAENLTREDLSDIEKGNGIRKLMQDGNLKQKEVAERLSIQPSAVTRMLALLGLPSEVQDLVHEGHLSASTAHQLTDLESPDDQKELAGKIVDERLSRQAAAREIAVRQEQRDDEAAAVGAADDDPIEGGHVGGGEDVPFASDAKGPDAKPKKAKAGPKAKAAGKKKEKVKTTWNFASNGYKLFVERPKGIDREGLLNALEAGAEQLRMAIEDEGRRVASEAK